MIKTEGPGWVWAKFKWMGQWIAYKKRVPQTTGIE